MADKIPDLSKLFIPPPEKRLPWWFYLGFVILTTILVAGASGFFPF